MTRRNTILTETQDMFGQRLQSGDDFVISMLSGKKAAMRAGRIVSFEYKNDMYAPDGKRLMMKVRWYNFNARSAWVPESGTSVIHLWPERLVKVDIDSILTPVVD